MRANRQLKGADPDHDEVQISVGFRSSISIVIPAYNEESRLSSTLDQVLDFVPPAGNGLPK